MRFKFLKTLIVMAVSAVVLPSAHAQETVPSSTNADAMAPVPGHGYEPDNGWTLLNDLSRSITCRGVRCGDDDDFTYTLDVLYTSSTAAPGILFSCSDRFGISAALSYEPTDMFGLFNRDRSGRVRTVEGWLRINEERGETSKFIRLRTVKSVEVYGDKNVLRLLNAVRRGDSVVLDIAGMKAVPYEFAAPGKELDTFIAGCSKLSSSKPK